jgi:TonB family protein
VVDRDLGKLGRFGHWTRQVIGGNTRLTTTLVIAFGAAFPAARGQTRARVAGVVVSEDGARVAGAQLRIGDTSNRPALSDDDGRFEFYVLGDPGSHKLLVRRIGFRPESLLVRLPRPDTALLQVKLVRTAQFLTSVIVKGEASDLMSTSAQVHERQRRSANGYFIYRDQIAKMEDLRMSEILRGIPGVRLAVGNAGATNARLRASRCAPLFWIDGVPLSGAPFDVDGLAPSDVEAIEIYSSAATVPVEFRGPLRGQGCGSIVIWTREGERRPKRSPIGADSIARLVDAARVFLPAEVDSEARMLTIPQPEYPDSLHRAKVAGAVLAEFIVDPTGAIVQESIGVVSSSHALFGDAVRLALRGATFAAAVRRGHRVAQVVQLPFTFTPPG